MGRVDNIALRSNEVLFALLGVSMGDWVAFPKRIFFNSREVKFMYHVTYCS